MGNEAPQINPTGLDAYSPSEVARRIEEAGIAKSRLPAVPLMTLSVLAGSFIALGAAAFTAVMAGTDLSYGPARLLGGLIFSLGLVLVVVAGAELFTGNTLIVMAWVDRKIRLRDLLRNWLFSFSGNAAGALAIVALMALAGLLKGQVGELAIRIAEAKASLGWTEALARGILCNMLVCLAVWLTFAARDVAGQDPGHPAADLGLRPARIRALDCQSLPDPRRLDGRGVGRMAVASWATSFRSPSATSSAVRAGWPSPIAWPTGRGLTASVGGGFRRRFDGAALFGVDRLLAAGMGRRGLRSAAGAAAASSCASPAVSVAGNGAGRRRKLGASHWL